jgi:glutamate dehydrogenase/leucine dehydrogenase
VPDPRFLPVFSVAADSTPAIYAKDGFDVKAVRQAKRETGQLPAGAGEELEPEKLLELEVDVLVPAAMEDVITADNADRIKAPIVLEVANGPTSIEADEILAACGVTVIPDVLANGGGVTVSYFEWVQNRAGVRWNPEEVAEKLRERMVRKAERVSGLAEDREVTLRTAAYAQSSGESRRPWTRPATPRRSGAGVEAIRCSRAGLALRHSSAYSRHTGTLIHEHGIRHTPR